MLQNQTWNCNWTENSLKRKVCLPTECTWQTKGSSWPRWSAGRRWCAAQDGWREPSWIWDPWAGWSARTSEASGWNSPARSRPLSPVVSKIYRAFLKKNFTFADLHLQSAFWNTQSIGWLRCTSLFLTWNLSYRMQERFVLQLIMPIPKFHA